MKITIKDVLALSHVIAALDPKVYAVDRIQNAVASWFGRLKKTETGETVSASYAATKGITKGKVTTMESYESAEKEGHLFAIEHACLTAEEKLGIKIRVTDFSDFNAVVFLNGFKFENLVSKGSKAKGNGKPVAATPTPLPASRAAVGNGEPVAAK